ncbi:hypothetical protein [Lacinutrix jangbogonensis]|nr:hypothetical protein [Lacinutrix jangbogonensis]
MLIIFTITTLLIIAFIGIPRKRNTAYKDSYKKKKGNKRLNQ